MRNFNILFLLLFISCNSNKSNGIEETDSLALVVDTRGIEVLEEKVAVEDLRLYNLQNIGDSQGTYFIWLTESYRWKYNDQDSIIDPHYLETNHSEYNYHVLDSARRARFLDSVQVSESDTITVYNYHLNTLTRYPVSETKLIAQANAYSPNSAPYPPYYFQIGFELSKLNSASYDQFAYAHIGKQQPFVRGSFVQTVWTHFDASKFRSLSDSTLSHWASEAEIKPIYHFEHERYTYFARPTREADVSIYANLEYLVINPSDSITFHYITRDSEGASPVPLIVADGPFYDDSHENNPNYGPPESYQYAGQLFKGQPPVINNLMWWSFGCESVYFVENDVQVGIACDNRH